MFPLPRMAGPPSTFSLRAAHPGRCSHQSIWSSAALRPRRARAPAAAKSFLDQGEYLPNCTGPKFFLTPDLERYVLSLHRCKRYFQTIRSPTGARESELLKRRWRPISVDVLRTYAVEAFRAEL